MTPPQRNPEDRPVAALLAPDILALLEESPADIAVETEEIHPADLADVAELLEREQLQQFLTALGPARAADVLEYLDEELRTEFLEAITPRQAAELVTQMTPDDRADTLEEISEEHAEEILSEIPAEARQETEKLLAYEPDTAGGLMTTEFVSVSADMTVEAALENVRAVARSGRKEAMHAIYTTDEQGRVVGVMSLRELLAAPAGAKISDIAWSEVVSVSPARRPRRSRARDRQLRPRRRPRRERVGPPDGRDHRRRRHRRDPGRADGRRPEARRYGGARRAVFDDLVLAMIREARRLAERALPQRDAHGDGARRLSEGDRKQTVLALFLPLDHQLGRQLGLAGHVPAHPRAGAARSRPARLVARRGQRARRGPDARRDPRRDRLLENRALAVAMGSRVVDRKLPPRPQLRSHDDQDRDGRRDVPRHGVVMAGQHHLLALTVGVSLLGVVMFGTLVGSMLPFAFRRLGFDPASASAPFIATFVDVTGLIIYFNVALHILLR